MNMKKRECVVLPSEGVTEGFPRLVFFAGRKSLAAQIARAVVARGFHVEACPVPWGWPWFKRLATDAPYEELSGILLDHFENVIRVERDGDGYRAVDVDGRPHELGWPLSPRGE